MSQASGLRSQVSGLRSQVFGLRSQVSDLRSQVSGLRSLVSGLGPWLSFGCSWHSLDVLRAVKPSYDSGGICGNQGRIQRKIEL